MKRLLGIAIIGLLASGCASGPKTVTLSADSAASLSGKTIARSVHEKPGFMAVTPGKAAFAVVGAFAMLEAGNDLVEKHQIDDPAHRLSQQLQALLQNEYDMKAVADRPVKVTSDEIDEIRQAVPEGDVALDAMTIGWGFSYGGFDFSHYNVNAQIQVRLIDLATGEVLASNRCGGPELPKDQWPTHDDLLANDATLLKSRLEAVADHCTRIVAAEVFGVDATGEVIAASQ